MTDEYYMKKALELAKIACNMGEVPVGAVVVKKSSGEIVGQGYNRRETDKSATAHAEIIAINQASENLGGWRLVDCKIYVTLEPCIMCAGAIINSRLEQVIFGANDINRGYRKAVGNLFGLDNSYNIPVTSGVLAEQCSGIISEFFRNLRKK